MVVDFSDAIIKHDKILGSVRGTQMEWHGKSSALLAGLGFCYLTKK